MDYISAEEFKKQPEKVQKVLLDWVNLNITDYDLVYIKYDVMLYKDYINRDKNLIDEDSYPLLTETQIRRFIEEKTDCKIDVTYYNATGYDLVLYRKEELKAFESLVDCGEDLLQAYWKIACKIASE